jgi:hypothetical protein
MNKTVFAWAIIAILASFSAAAYVPYGGASYDYSHSFDSQSVTSHESEFQHSDSGYGSPYQHDSMNYDYGRSRTFSFSSTSETETVHQSNNYGYNDYAPYSPGSYSRDFSSYSYPSNGYDYRPFHDYYSMSFTSPYYDPARSTRVSGYAHNNYLPYGY